MNNITFISFNNEEEFAFIQKYYLKNGYTWASGSKDFREKFSYNISIYYDEKIIAEHLPHFPGGNVINASKLIKKIIRQEKIKRLWKN